MASSKRRTLVGNKQRPKALPRRQSSVGSHEHYLRREQELEDEIEDLQRELERSEKRLEAMKVVQQTLASGLDPNRLLMQLITHELISEQHWDVESEDWLWSQFSAIKWETRFSEEPTA